MSYSHLSEGQIIKKVYDADNDSLRVSPVAGQLVDESFDYIGVTYPSSTEEVYTYKTGGASGTTVAVVTVTYTDGTKENVSSVART